VFAIEPGGFNRADEELGSIRIWAGVRHAQNSRSGVLQRKIFIFKFVAVDGLAASAVVPGKISSLAHEFGDDPVERAALKTKALFPCAERSKVLGCFGYDIRTQFKYDAAERGAIGCNIKKAFGKLRIFGCAHDCFSGKYSD
jgi:hypothetical protein